MSNFEDFDLDLKQVSTTTNKFTYCSKRYVYNQISGGETRKNDTYIERSVIGRKICRDAEKPTNDS